MQSPIDIPAVLYRNRLAGVVNEVLHGDDIYTKIEFNRNLDFFASYGNIVNKTIANSDRTTIKVDFEKGSLVFVDEDDAITIFEVK